MEEHDTPMMKDRDFGFPHSNFERDNPKYSSYSIALGEPIGVVERSLGEPIIDRMSPWH